MSLTSLARVLIRARRCFEARPLHGIVAEHGHRPRHRADRVRAARSMRLHLRLAACEPRHHGFELGEGADDRPFGEAMKRHLRAGARARSTAWRPWRAHSPTMKLRANRSAGLHLAIGLQGQSCGSRPGREFRRRRRRAPCRSAPSRRLVVRRGRTAWSARARRRATACAHSCRPPSGRAAASSMRSLKVGQRRARLARSRPCRTRRQ